MKPDANQMNTKLFLVCHLAITVEHQKTQDEEGQGIGYQMLPVAV